MQGLVNDFRTFNWAQNIKYPELVYQKSVKLLSIKENNLVSSTYELGNTFL